MADQTYIATNQAGPNQSASLPQILDRIRSSSLTQLMQDASCGYLAGISCLCPPDMREIAMVLANKFGSDAELIFDRICPKCGVPNVQPTPVGMVPVSYTPPPGVITGGAPSPQGNICPEGLPAQGSYTTPNS